MLRGAWFQHRSVAIKNPNIGKALDQADAEQLGATVVLHVNGNIILITPAVDVWGFLKIAQEETGRVI